MEKKGKLVWEFDLPEDKFREDNVAEDEHDPSLNAGDADHNGNETVEKETPAHERYNLPAIGPTLPRGQLTMQDSLAEIYSTWNDTTNRMIEIVDGYDFAAVPFPSPGLEYFRKAAEDDLMQNSEKQSEKHSSKNRLLSCIRERINKLFSSSRPDMPDNSTQTHTPKDLQKTPQDASQSDAETLAWTQQNVIDDTPKNIHTSAIIKRFEECMGPDIYEYGPGKLAQFMKGLHEEKIAESVLETIDFTYTANTNYGLEKSVPFDPKSDLQTTSKATSLKNTIDAKLFRYITKWYNQKRIAPLQQYPSKNPSNTMQRVFEGEEE